MRFEPLHAYYACAEDPEAADAGKARILLGGTLQTAVATPATAWLKNHLPAPNKGRWYRVVALPEPNPLGLERGDTVCCNLTMRSHCIDVAGDGHALFDEKFVVSRMTFQRQHIPLGRHVLTRRNDEKHLEILRKKGESGVVLRPESTLNWGQKTSEPVALDPQEQEQRERQQMPERENDGVRVLFQEVVAVPEPNPDLPAQLARIQIGDMVGFKRLAATEVDFMGSTVHAVPLTAMVERVPASEFRLTSGN